MMLLFIALICFATAAYYIGALVTAPARERQKCCSLRPVMRTALILPRYRVPATGFGHDFLKIAAVPDCFFQFLRQLLRHVDRKSAIPLATIQRIAGMSLA